MGTLRKNLLLLAVIASNAHAAANETAPELVLQSGHTQFIGQLAFSPDGRFLASGGFGNAVKIWDVEQGLEIWTLRGHTKDIAALAFSHDGRFVATAGHDNVIKLWDASTGKELFSRSTGEHVMGMVGLAFDPSGHRLVSLHQDRTVTEWGIPAGDELRTIGIPRTGEAFFTRLTPDARYVATDVDLASTHRALELWDVSSANVVSHKLVPPEADANTKGLALSPDGQWLAWKNGKGSINLWDVSKGRLVYELSGNPKASVDAVTFSPDSKFLAVGDGDAQTVRLLESATGRQVRLFEHVFAESLRFTDDGNRLAAVKNQAIEILDLRTGGRIVQVLQGYLRSKSGIALSRDNRFLAAANEDETTELWDLNLGRLVRCFGNAERSRDNNTVAFSSDGKTLAAGFAGPGPTGQLIQGLKLWDLKTGQEIRTLGGFFNLVVSIAFSPDGALLAAGDYNGNLKIWESSTGNQIESLPGEGTANISSVVVGGELVFEPAVLAFSGDGHWLAAVRDQSVALWDVGRRAWVKRFSGGVITAVAFSPDNQRLAFDDFLEKTVKVVDINSGQPVWSVPNEQQRVSGLAFSPDGRSLASSGDDGTIRLLDAASGHESVKLLGHAGGVNGVAFTSDGRWLVSAGDDGSVRLWDSSKGKAAAVLAAMGNSTDWAVVTPDGLFDGSTDATQKLVAWRVGTHLYPADRFFASNCTPSLLKRLLDGERLAPGVMLDAATLPPTVEIHFPPSTAGFQAGPISVSVSAKDNGGGVGVVTLFHNGKSVGKRPGVAAGNYLFDVDLIAGENLLRATATSRKGVEANDQQVRVAASAPANSPALVKPILRLLVVGVSQYEDPGFDLPLAHPDASAIAAFFEKDTLFASVDSIKLYDAEATRQAVREALANLSKRANPQDVLLVYLAGHGTGLDEQFYFLPHDMRREADTDAAIRKYGIPASALADALAEAKALKQVLILDTCESESALPLLAKNVLFRSRGISSSEEKAVRTLARSYGVYLIAASTRDQEAYELRELGHGVLTYALLTGLGENGDPKAPTSTEGIVTIESLVQYAHDKVPELSETYHHAKQYPVTSTTGTDFPLWAR